MPKDAYVLVTPARNEEATIATTIQSVLSQTLLPRKWVIVSDRSTDRTDQIAAEYVSKNDFIRLAHIEGRGAHSFASVVRAFERGIAALPCVDYCYLGLLDADV
jgi:biofilm PGA synthesis N-glycosyltransferase PgaC